MSTKQIIKQTKGQLPAPLKALEAVLYGLKYGVTLGLEHEAKLLGEMVVTPESKSLTHVFLLSEGAKKLGKSLIDSLGDIRALVVGAGTMGAGIASTLLQQKIPVVLRDSDELSLQKARSHIEKTLDKRSSLTPAEKRALLDLLFLQRTGDDRLRDCNLLIEAVTEKVEIKLAVLQELSAKIDKGALIASNTSSLSITSLSSALPSPGSVVGMHFFNPVEKMPLVEIVRSKATTDRSLLITAALAVKLGKFPIIVEDVPGFLVNRILFPYFQVACKLLLAGIEPLEIEEAAIKFGFPMGPFRVLDEVGLEVVTHVGEILEKGYGERMKLAAGPRELVSFGRLGRKNNKGFYNYSTSTNIIWPELVRTIASNSRPQRVHRELIADCLVTAIVNEAVRCLDEGVAGQPSVEAANQIDLGMVMGAGFPAFRGGPLYYADKLGARSLLQLINQVNAAFNGLVQPWSGIVSRAEVNGAFSSAPPKKVT
jgi:3-hydroxyacyl-CoA dehydrogenase/enoyl-CoA hydratase/3-hydroxybutyryl-CoA epimerase